MNQTEPSDLIAARCKRCYRLVAKCATDRKGTTQWSEILRKIDGPVAADTPADETEDWDDAEDDYNGGEADEDCWTPYARRA